MKGTNTHTNIRHTRMLLDAVRGCLRGTAAAEVADSKAPVKRSLRYFPLQRQHVFQSPATPSDFHSVLCDKIRSAKKRVTLASLYIGPAADPVYEKEIELLEALREASSRRVAIKILLDQNRALRPVPYKHGTITSAEACWMALTPSADFSSDSTSLRPPHFSIHLFSVLPAFLQRFLPNPYNEVAGVFHIKVYIVDDELILSGANLSEEYFSDRVDRYLHVAQTDLVQFYADMVDAISQQAHLYTRKNGVDQLQSPSVSRRELMKSLTALFTSDTATEQAFDLAVHEDPQESSTGMSSSSSSIVAYAVPTFQAPRHFYSKIWPSNNLRSDEEALGDLIAAAATTASSSSSSTASGIEARISSAYLNPTRHWLDALKACDRAHLLTAGRQSHGFKPKPKAGNKGKDWIPSVFEYAAQKIQMSNVMVSYYQRPDWTFHSKGLWLTNATGSSNLRLPPDATVYAVAHGSGNYGYRSAIRDMESNLVLVLPPGSSLAQDHIDEWNQLCDFAVPASEEGGDQQARISSTIKLAFPLIRRFF